MRISLIIHCGQVKQRENWQMPLKLTGIYSHTKKRYPTVKMKTRFCSLWEINKFVSVWQTSFSDTFIGTHFSNCAWKCFEWHRFNGSLCAKNEASYEHLRVKHTSNLPTASIPRWEGRPFHLFCLHRKASNFGLFLSKFIENIVFIFVAVLLWLSSKRTISARCAFPKSN